MSHFVRQSKYRHIYANAPATDKRWEGLRLSTAQGDGQYIKANTKFFAVALSGGGGPVGIFNIDHPQRLSATALPSFFGHKGNVLDFDFNPFDEHMIATGSDDTTIKLWRIPEGGLSENCGESIADLHGHGKKVTLLRFHPTANNILGSVSADHTVKVWDVEGGQDLFTAPEHPDLIQDLVWDNLGKMYATSCKDKTVRIFDARENMVAMEIPTAHDGSKASKLTFLGDKDKLFTVGFTRQSQRQMKIWDPRDLGKPLKTENLDTASGVLIPYYDPDTSVLYLAGKGDGNIRYFEIVNDAPYLCKLDEFRTTVSARGVCFVPKRGLDVMKCETARAMKLTGNAVEPISFVVPRRSEAFQEDIYPPTFAGVPGCSADQWLDGANVPTAKISLDPSADGQIMSAAAAEEPASSGVKTRSQLQRELEAAEQYITVLTQALTDAGKPVPSRSS